MSDRYLDIRTMDRMELDDVFRDEVVGQMRTDVGNVVEELFDDLEDVNWGKKKRAEIADAVAEVVIEFMRSSGKFAN